MAKLQVKQTEFQLLVRQVHVFGRIPTAAGYRRPTPKEAASWVRKARRLARSAEAILKALPSLYRGGPTMKEVDRDLDAAFRDLCKTIGAAAVILDRSTSSEVCVYAVRFAGRADMMGVWTRAGK